MIATENTPEDVLDGPVAWLDGRFVAASAAAISVTDLGLHGLAVTEMVRTYEHELFRLDDHLKRLRRSLEASSISCDIDGLNEICRMVARRNASYVDQGSDIGVVMFVTAGGNPTYLPDPGGPTVCVHTFELPLGRWADGMQNGVRLLVSKVRQIPGDCIPNEAKTRSRMHWHLAATEVRKRDPGAQAVLLDNNGALTETPASNIFAVFEDTVVTPCGNVLPGVSRDVVRELCPLLGLNYEERTIRPDDIGQADEMFVSSTPFGLMPVTKFEDVLVGSGRPGPVFFELCNALSEQVGIDIIDQVMSATA